MPHVHFWHTFPMRHRKTPLMAQKRTCSCKKCGDCGAPIEYVLDHIRWFNYYATFNPKNRKPSTGTQAVFCAVQRWQPESIGLIGFDWILDGNPGWFHDAEAELRAIESLVEVVDLRRNIDVDTVCRI